jgi:hypothetical protein
MKQLLFLLFGFAWLFSFIINLHLLFTAIDYEMSGINEIDWSWLFNTELHHWGIFVTNLIFSLSNLMFLFLGMKKFYEMFPKKNDSSNGN